MRILSAFIIFLAVFFSDVVSHTYAFHNENLIVSDLGNESENEKEGEFENELKEESKIQNHLHFKLEAISEAHSIRLIFLNFDRYLTPYRKIHNPPPEFG